jgi:hypothetical protein
MHPDDLLKPDLLSEVLSLGNGVLLAIALLMIIVAACERTYPRTLVGGAFEVPNVMTLLNSYGIPAYSWRRAQHGKTDGKQDNIR